MATANRATALQTGFIVPALPAIKKRTLPHLEISGLEHIVEHKGGANIFVTHSDILSDFIYTGEALYLRGLPTPHIVVGENLASNRLTRWLFLQNKAIFMPRNEGMKKGAVEYWQALLDAGEYVLSSNMQGRSKNGRYATSPNVLRASSAGRTYCQFSEEIPQYIAIASYEFIPSARRMALQRVTGKKGRLDDTRDLFTVLEYKGRGRIAISERVVEATPEAAAAKMDEHIRTKWPQWPTTRAAQLMLTYQLEREVTLDAIAASEDDPKTKQRMASFVTDIVPRFRKHNPEQQERLTRAFCEIYAGPNGT